MDGENFEADGGEGFGGHGCAGEMIGSCTVRKQAERVSRKKSRLEHSVWLAQEVIICQKQKKRGGQAGQTP